MTNSIKDQLIDNYRLLRGAWRVSLSGSSNRLQYGLLELVPNLVFYLAHAIIVLTMFRTIGGESVAVSKLILFLLVMICVDSIGDSMIFKGIGEYTRCLRRGETLYYLLTPGTPFLKVLLFRWDMPMLVLGFAAGAGAVVMGSMLYDASPLFTTLCIGIGIIAHGVLTSAFHIIQAYFDPTMPIAFGSPASRFYTKPLHLFVSGNIGLFIMIAVYPAYLITALPAGVASMELLGGLTQFPLACYVAGVISLVLWGVLLNIVIVKSCTRR